MSWFTRRSLCAAAVSGLAALAIVLLPALSASAGAAQSAPTTARPSLFARTILTGTNLQHTYTVNGTTTTATEPLSKPDDITQFDGLVFVGFQNGVQPQGQPSTDGNTDSTIVAMTKFAVPLAQWDIQGKCDGLTADPAINGLIATVNEDANSSLYTITVGAKGTVDVQHYTYNKPLPHNGGTDAISIDGSSILISASTPGTTGTLSAPQPTFPAVYSVTLDSATSVAKVASVFYDEDTATVANTGSQHGHRVKLSLTDPDSNEVVPATAPRFAGNFMLTSQGDLEQIFVSNLTHPNNSMSVLSLSQSVDDTAWANAPGVLYATDSTNDAIDVIGGAFPTNPVVAVTPCGSNSAPATCPAPGFPPNYLGELDPSTGTVTQLTVGGAAFVPQGGLVFVPFPQPSGQG